MSYEENGLLIWPQEPTIAEQISEPVVSFQVQKNIAARGNEWDKNSPVWTNKNYLNDIYTELKRNYLKKMQ